MDKMEILLVGVLIGVVGIIGIVIISDRIGGGSIDIQLSSKDFILFPNKLESDSFTVTHTYGEAEHINIRVETNDYRILPLKNPKAVPDGYDEKGNPYIEFTKELGSENPEPFSFYLLVTKSLPPEGNYTYTVRAKKLSEEEYTTSETKKFRVES